MCSLLISSALVISLLTEPVPHSKSGLCLPSFHGGICSSRFHQAHSSKLPEWIWIGLGERGGKLRLSPESASKITRSLDPCQSLSLTPDVFITYITSYGYSVEVCVCVLLQVHMGCSMYEHA